MACQPAGASWCVTELVLGDDAMMLKAYVAISLIAAAVAGVPPSARAQDMPADYRQVLSTLGKQGDYKDNVLKVNIPATTSK